MDGLTQTYSDNRALASMSLDLDNQWSYMKTHGDQGWDSFPSYLPLVIPRFLGIFEDLGVTSTVFVVGQDADLAQNHEALASITAAGHEVGNHSYHHEPWLQRYTREEIESELERAESAIVEVTGYRPIGFRGPGYSVSQDVLEVLRDRGYQYDASTFPTYIGPVARAYYFVSASLTTKQREERGQLFGTIRDGLRPLRPYLWNLVDGPLLEIPVTTLPILKTPIHLSYVLYLSTYSSWLAATYFRVALAMCRRTGVEPSLLLHPLDFLGADDVAELSFFPGMNIRGADKLDRVRYYLSMFTQQFRVLPMREHADAIRRRSLRRREPDFREAVTS